jgi:hypothetical protein
MQHRPGYHPATTRRGRKIGLGDRRRSVGEQEKRIGPMRDSQF